MLSEGSKNETLGGSLALELSAPPIEALALVPPHASPLQYAGEDDAHRTLFTGTLVMDGTWRFRWLDEVSYEFVFLPDDESTLPHWSNEPVAIAFENDQAVLNAVMTNKARLGLRLRRHVHIFGRARITADHLTTAVDSQGNPHCWMRCRDVEIPQKAQPSPETAKPVLTVR